MKQKQILYFSGLSGQKPNGFDTRILHHLEKQGIQTEFATVDWRSNESFAHLLERMTAKANDLLQSTGSLALVGASAGGSLAVNVFDALASDTVTAISLSGRLRSGKLPAWDLRTLERSSHLGAPKASQLCYDSIMYCGDSVLPNLSDARKQQITLVRPLVDPVVPISTMSIEDIEPLVIPAIGHKLGIAMGLFKLPDIL